MRQATAMAVLLVLLMTGGVHSAGMPPEAKGAESATAGVSAGEFIGPDGRIDLDAVRQSGYEGNLDLEGSDVTIDPSTGQHLLRPTVAAETDSDPDDIYWSPLGSGMNGTVSVLTVYDGNLIAGGGFTVAGGEAANRIASWDGSSWSPLGSGTNGGVSALTVYDGKLIAGGGFTEAGGVAANRIASWDGSSWSPLGSGMDAWVNQLTVYEGNLIAGGSFHTAGSVAANHIASWDGRHWSRLDSGTDRSVYAQTLYEGMLIAGGLFSEAGGVSTGTVASWDGHHWSPVGVHFAEVDALTVCNGDLFAAGWMWEPEDNNGYIMYLYEWQWSSLVPQSAQLIPRVLGAYDGKLIVGGTFPSIRGVSANNIASWDGSSWSPLGSGTDNTVRALTVYDGELIVGGYFTTAGDKVAAHVAAWTKSCCLARGDINHNGAVLPTDAVYFVDWLWRGGPEPPCMLEADVNGSESVDPQDCIYFVNYMWNGGPAPVPCP